MRLPGILASQLFVFNPLKYTKQANFPKKQSSSLASAVPTESADSASLHAFYDGAVDHSLASDVVSQLTDLSYEKLLGINGVSPYVRNRKLPLPLLNTEDQYYHASEVSRALHQM